MRSIKPKPGASRTAGGQLSHCVVGAEGLTSRSAQQQQTHRARLSMKLTTCSLRTSNLVRLLLVLLNSFISSKDCGGKNRPSVGALRQGAPQRGAQLLRQRQPMPFCMTGIETEPNRAGLCLFVIVNNWEESLLLGVLKKNIK